MRELIYLSEGKLQQFVAYQPLSWRSHLRIEGEIKIPGIGGVKVVPADPTRDKRAGPTLDEVISALESSGRAARWFADEEARPGQWVYFEAPLSYMTIGESVIFLDLGEPTATYPTGGVIRFILHGSCIHLAGSVAPRPLSREYLNAASHSKLQHMLRQLNSYLAAKDAELDANATRSDWENRLEPFRRIISVLDRDLDLPHTSAWMAGYARITAMMPSSSNVRIVIATPLYVEYIAEPQVVD